MLTGRICPVQMLQGSLIQPIIRVESDKERFTGSVYGYGSIQTTEIGQQTLMGIEFDGTKYLNLGIRPTNNTCVEICFSQNEYGKFLFGCRSSGSSSDAIGFCAYSGQIYPQFGSFQSALNYSMTLRDTHVLRISQDGAYLDGTCVKSFSEMSFESTLDMYFGTRNQNGSLDNRMFTGKLYYIMVTENNALVQYMVPFYTGTGEETGLYDIPSGRFYHIQTNEPQMLLGLRAAEELTSADTDVQLSRQEGDALPQADAGSVIRASLTDDGSVPGDGRTELSEEKAEDCGKKAGNNNEINVEREEI